MPRGVRLLAIVRSVSGSQPIRVRQLTFQPIGESERRGKTWHAASPTARRQKMRHQKPWPVSSVLDTLEVRTYYGKGMPSSVPLLPAHPLDTLAATYDGHCRFHSASSL